MFLVQHKNEIDIILTIYLCKECGHAQADIYETDKCPMCRNDNWLAFDRYEDEDEDEMEY